MDLPADIADIARELGLEAVAEGTILPRFVIRGELDGQQVELLFGGQGMAKLTALVDPPLDLGLRVEMMPFMGASPDDLDRIRLGDDNWDRGIQAFADEGSRGQALFGPELKAAVLALNVALPGFELYDAGVKCTLAGDLPSAARRLAHVAGCMRAARHVVACASALSKHAEAWAAIAHDNGSTIEPTPLRAGCTIRGMTWRAVALRTDVRAYRLSIEARWNGLPTRTGLSIRRERAFNRVKTFLGAADIQTGDEAFDRTFVVAADDAAWIEQRVDDDVRRALLEAAERFEDVTVTSLGMKVGGPAERIDPSSAKLVAGWAELIAERVIRGSERAGGPYR